MFSMGKKIVSTILKTMLNKNIGSGFLNNRDNVRSNQEKNSAVVKNLWENNDV